MKMPHLNQQLVLLNPVRTPDGAGGYVTEWAALGIHWGEVQSSRGTAQHSAGARRVRRTVKVVIRAFPPGAEARPEPGQRFRCGARNLDILAVAEIGPRARYLEITTQEETAA